MRTILALLLGAIVLASCGQDACPNASASSDAAGAPRIEKLWLIDHAMPDDPWALVLALTFRDSKGDLSNGSVSVYVNGHDTPAKLDLLASFRDSALAEDSAAGTLTLPAIRISNVSNGDSVRLGARLTDASGLQSNCYSLDLDFSVTAAVNRLPPQLRRLWAWLWLGSRYG